MSESALPDPLVPADVDLRDFAFMPLDVQRLRDSDLASDETPESCWAAVLLWCASWHQVPAASIPDNEGWQAKQAGYVSRGRVDAKWARVKVGALRGWLLCSDGRLYHPVVAEKAIDAWRGKLEQRWRTEASRVKKHNQRHNLAGLDAVQMPDFEQWLSLGCPQGQALPVPRDMTGVSPGSPHENGSKGQGEGQGQGQGQGKEEKNPSGSVDSGRPPAETPTIPCPYGQIVDAYHRELTTLPKVRLRDGPTWLARQKAMRSLWGWVLSSRKSDGSPRAETAEQALHWIASYFARARDNDFVMGRRRPGQGHENWRADFDYLVSPKGLKQVIEKTQEAA